MKKIYKYIISAWSERLTVLDLPEDSKILKFGNQNERAVVWILHDPDMKKKPFVFRAVWTGEKFEDPEYYDYVGTAQFQNGSYIVHLFLERSERQ